MLLLLFLVITELLTILVFRHHYKGFSKTKYYLSNLINVILSLFMWMLYIEVKSYRGSFDNPAHIWLMMSLTGAFCAILLPRILLIIFHFTGWIIRFRKGGHIRSLTNTGIITWIIILLFVLAGVTAGRHNYKTDYVTIKTEKLNSVHDSLTIIQISDLHLAGFYRHKDELARVIDRINSYNPDLLINTGDFISFGWREFDRFDTILAAASGRYGSYAVFGNHDMGTYNPDFDAAGRDTNIARMDSLISSSGYRLLRDENVIIGWNGISISIAGITTSGRHPTIIHGDLKKAMEGTDSADFRILLSHDPNFWRRTVTGKTGIDLTLSGHTHGMQMGIMTKRLKWSPSVFFYPEWQGLFSEGSQYLYVNRGLGVLGIPFRIGMPPEITVIKLKGTK
jgi:hypothetical protein